MNQLLHFISSSRSSARVARALVAAAAVMAASEPASAMITSSFVANGDGTVTYSYEVDNSTGLFDVAAWALEFNLPSPDWNQLDSLSGGDVSVPNASWFADAGIPVTGLSAQDFISLDPSSDVLAGAILGGFSFTSSFQPGPVTFHEFSALGDVISGTTIGPVIALADGRSRMGTLALAALAVGAMGLWQRRAKTA
jgi:hypothetical protein